MEMITKYPNIAAACRYMTDSGGDRFEDDAHINYAIASLAGGTLHQQGSAYVITREIIAKAEEALAKFAEEHAFAHQWAGEGQDDEGNEPPIGVEAEAVLEAIYNW